MSRAAFYDAIRPQFPGGTIETGAQVARMEALLDAMEIADWRPTWRAYGFASAFHESDRFRTAEEYGKGAGQPYGDPCRLYRDQVRTYYGRGPIQVTWLHNYARMSLALDMDLVSDPDLLLDPQIGAKSLVIGMERGLYTGRKLADCTDGEFFDFVRARAIVNGEDRAMEIAGYAQRFLRAFVRA